MKTEEEIAAEKAAAEAKEEPVDSEEVKTLKESQVNLVEEIKILRSDKQIVEGERDALIAKANPVKPTPDPTPAPAGAPAPATDQNDVDSKVEAALLKRDQATLIIVRQNVEAKFKSQHQEFAEDNDPGGLKYKAFLAKLGRIDFNLLLTEAQITEAYEDSLFLLNKGKVESGPINNNPYAITPSDTSPTVTAAQNNGMTHREKTLVESLGWTEEKYLKLKASRPQYVNSLLDNY